MFLFNILSPKLLPVLSTLKLTEEVRGWEVRGEQRILKTHVDVPMYLVNLFINRLHINWYALALTINQRTP